MDWSGAGQNQCKTSVLRNAFILRGIWTQTAEMKKCKMTLWIGHNFNLYPWKLFCCPLLQLTITDTGSWQSWVTGVRKEGHLCVCEEEGDMVGSSRELKFSMVGSLVCLWTTPSEDVEDGRESTHKDTIRRDEEPAIICNINSFPFSLPGLNAPCWPVMYRKHSFPPTDTTPLLILWPRADIRLGCIAANRFLALKCGALCIPELAFHFPSFTHHLSGYVVAEYTLICCAGNRWTASYSTREGHIMVKTSVLVLRTVLTQLL